MAAPSGLLQPAQSSELCGCGWRRHHSSTHLPKARRSAISREYPPSYSWMAARSSNRSRQSAASALSGGGVSGRFPDLFSLISLFSRPFSPSRSTAGAGMGGDETAEFCGFLVNGRDIPCLPATTWSAICRYRPICAPNLCCERSERSERSEISPPSVCSAPAQNKRKTPYLPVATQRSIDRPSVPSRRRMAFPALASLSSAASMRSDR